MQQLQLLGLLTLTLLVVNPSQCNPIGEQCALEPGFSSISIVNLDSLEKYDVEVTNQPNRLNERSLAAWEYVEVNKDVTRVPQVIYEARCLTTHSCNGVNSAYSVESVPLTFKMPVLRKHPGCPFYSIEFESVTMACICATSRRT
ncbi:interleukin-25 [Salminus brasiliensis]|uniref:interleukin-25 n=1 Tax=Salminus brasiliensis TaxID=930266 RepID=UPI003B839640